MDIKFGIKNKEIKRRIVSSSYFYFNFQLQFYCFENLSLQIQHMLSLVIFTFGIIFEIYYSNNEDVFQLYILWLYFFNRISIYDSLIQHKKQCFHILRS